MLLGGHHVRYTWQHDRTVGEGSWHLSKLLMTPATHLDEICSYPDHSAVRYCGGSKGLHGDVRDRAISRVRRHMQECTYLSIGKTKEQGEPMARVNVLNLSGMPTHLPRVLDRWWKAHPDEPPLGQDVDVIPESTGRWIVPRKQTERFYKYDPNLTAALVRLFRSSPPPPPQQQQQQQPPQVGSQQARTRVTVLDAGAGTGHYVRRLRDAGLDAVGIDGPSAAALSEGLVRGGDLTTPFAAPCERYADPLSLPLSPAAHASPPYIPYRALATSD